MKNKQASKKAIVFSLNQKPQALLLADRCSQQDILDKIDFNTADKTITVWVIQNEKQSENRPSTLDSARKPRIEQKPPKRNKKLVKPSKKKPQTQRILSHKKYYQKVQFEATFQKRLLEVYSSSKWRKIVNRDSV